LRTFANCVAIFFILHFCWSYYWNCYRKGYRIDYWHFNLFQMLMVTSIMLPFNRSQLNVLFIGPILLKHTLPLVDKAFLISALGYGSVLVGGSLWRVNLHLGLRQAYSRILNQPIRAAALLLRSPRLLFLFGLMAFVLICGILALYFSIAGFGVNLSSLLIVRPELRPLAQFGAFVAITVGTLALGRYEILRERSMLFISGLLCLGLFFYGSRSLGLAIIEVPLLIWMIRRRTRLRVIYLGAIFGLMVILVIVLDAVRHSAFSIATLLGAGIAIAFGNTFSDTRDFALTLSYWNGSYFLGKTYLAGFMAFVPRFLSPFRDKWALGVVTAGMIGFGPTEHAGLRIGQAGEAYLNFGLPAVIAIGLFEGSILKLIDLRIKESISVAPRDTRVYSYLYLAFLATVLTNSVGFSTLYTVAMLLIFSCFVVVLSRFVKLPLG
jgi:hypothetical protein